MSKTRLYLRELAEPLALLAVILVIGGPSYLDAFQIGTSLTVPAFFIALWLYTVVKRISRNITEQGGDISDD